MQQTSWLRALLLVGLLIVAAVMAFGVIGHAGAQAPPTADKPFVAGH